MKGVVLHDLNLLYDMQYILETSCYPREDKLLKQLREATVKKYEWR